MMLTALAAVVLSVPSVTVIQTPNSGIQPQAAVDARGTIHLLYFTGKPDEGNLEYVQSKDHGDTWTNPQKVNSAGNTAVAIGTIRGGQIAVSPNGNVHVVWLGTSKSPGLFYSQKRATDANFTEQKDLSDGTVNLDGGASVACDDASVYVVWHAGAKLTDGEDKRQLWLRTSRDVGSTFTKKSVLVSDQGACACCSTKAALDSRGRLIAMFRTALEGMDRDVFAVGWSWSFQVSKEKMDSWRVATCPMSSFSILASNPIVRAWETKGRVVVDGKTLPEESAKHPSLARLDGTVLCAYVVGSGWQKGGKLAWSLLDASGKVLESKKTEDDIPTWSLASAIAIPTKGYLIFK
jgi:hypothetical protein